LVLFESGRRLAAMLDDAANVLGPRPAAVCRELTKLHEEVRSGTAAQLADHYRRHPAKGEVTLVIAGTGRPPAPTVGDAEITLLKALVAGEPLAPRHAAKLVGAATGCAVNALYESLSMADP